MKPHVHGLDCSGCEAIYQMGVEAGREQAKVAKFLKLPPPPKLKLMCAHYRDGRPCQRCTRKRCALCDLCTECQPPKKSRNGKPSRANKRT